MNEFGYILLMFISKGINQGLYLNNKIPIFHCEFQDSLGNFLLSKYLGASKWKNEVMVIKNTPNENDWPRAILELCQKKKFSL